MQSHVFVILSPLDVKINARKKGETHPAFLAWGDLHARSRFARSTIPEEKWRLLVVYLPLWGETNNSNEA